MHPKRRSSDFFNLKVSELDKTGLFVKNLENIQGDERDIIILSTTFGIDKDGKFNEKFGPIIQKKGYRLFNVLITRAKYKVFVCTSIPTSRYLNFKERLILEGGNNRQAVFYAYLAYSKAVSENDKDLSEDVLNALDNNSNKEILDNKSYTGILESPFEEEVYDVIARNFDEEKIKPQLKFGGFRIDLVYDSGVVGIPKIAIECDGSKYHSSEQAYLYDLHRQKILESHGFVFHRIWSTNWWHNPKKETKRLIDFINDIEANGLKDTGRSQFKESIFAN